MPVQSNQFDVAWLSDLDLPYDRQTKELSPQPRITSGQDVWVTLGGKIRKRPPVEVSDFSSIASPGLKRIDRLWLYETLETPSKVYVMASMEDLGTNLWEMYYVRLDASPAPTAWTSVGSTRALSSSERAHEAVVVNGLFYIKGFPTVASGEKLGTVIFDGSGTPSTKLWGLLGPTVAAVSTSKAGWSASANATTINFGWKYAYSWKTNTGHISNRSPLAVPTGVGATSASDTGAFSNLQPEIEVQGHADTTNVPTIVIWRTTDGGGSFFYVDEIVNTGAGTIVYTDENRTGTPGDPKTDFQLDTANIAPSLTSNSPPPTVLAPEVVGTDTPVPSSPIVEFQARIWYAIGNVLFFSGQEEILNGVPFESFPSGTNGNFFRFRSKVQNLIPTREVLYVLLDNDVAEIRGTNRLNLQARLALKDLGGKAGQPAAATSFQDTAFYLTHDNQVAAIRDGAAQILSFPLGSDLDDAISSSTHVTLAAHAFQGNAWLLVAVRAEDSDDSKVWVYDFQRSKWNTPWIEPVSTLVSGKYRESDETRKIVWANMTGSNESINLMEIDSTTQDYEAVLETNPFEVPAGNHINLLRRAGHHPMLAYLVTERTKFGGDSNPTVQYLLDEISGSYTSPTANDPPFVAQPTTVNMSWWPVQKVCRRVKMKVTSQATGQFELQNVGFVFQSEAGA